jgi:prepilin-type N-terminal cleavage/methylation domain-containing protein
MKLNRKTAAGFTLVELLVVIVIIAALAGLTAPQIIRFRKKGDQTEAMNNARQLMLGLADFESDYGGFPDTSTREDVTENSGSTLNFSGDTANDYFRQLIAAGIVQSENPFYAKASYSKKPDNIFNGNNALEAGEVGFGYIMDNDSAIGTGNPGRPIAVAALLNASTSGDFDVEPYDRKAVVLHIDSSVKLLNIRPTDNKAIMGGGKTLLQTGEETVWGTEINPVIKAPERRGGGSGSAVKQADDN